MQVQVQVTLHGEELNCTLAVPGRPVVGGEYHFKLATPKIDGLGNVVRPSMRVAYHSAADGEDVVQGVGRILRHADSPMVWEVEVHLRRRLGARGDLEHDAQPVDPHLLAGAADVDRRRDERRFAGRGRLAQPGADLSGRSLLYRGAVHVTSSASHRGPRKDVLGDGMLHEPLGSHDRDTSSVDIGLVDDALDPAEVVDVGMGVDHSGDRALATVLLVQRERGRGRLLTDQRVDDDHPSVPLQDTHDGQVVTPNLIDPRPHLEQTILDKQLALPPQARVHRVRRRAVQKGVRVKVPNHATIIGGDLAPLTASDEPTFGVAEILNVVQRQPLSGSSYASPGRFRGAWGRFHGCDPGRTHLRRASAARQPLSGLPIRGR